MIYLPDKSKNSILPYYSMTDVETGEVKLIPACKYEVSDTINLQKGWIVEETIKNCHFYKVILKTLLIQNFIKEFNSPSSQFSLLLCSNHIQSGTGSANTKFQTKNMKVPKLISKITAKDIQDDLNIIFIITVANIDIKENDIVFLEVFAHEFFLHVYRYLSVFKQCLKAKVNKENIAYNIIVQYLKSEFCDKNNVPLTGGGELDHAKFIAGKKFKFQQFIHQLLDVLNKEDGIELLIYIRNYINNHVSVRLEKKYKKTNQYIKKTIGLNGKEASKRLMKKLNKKNYKLD